MTQELVEHEIDSPGNSALLLLCCLFDQTKSWILAHGDIELSPAMNQALQNDLERLLSGVPLPYVLGCWDFYGRSFKVSPDVLIPRPETELLVEKALAVVMEADQPKVVDVGTGSGAIAVSLAAELPQAVVIALDLSLPALKVARYNARRHAQSHIRFVQSNLLEPFQAQFDLICANLPYIPTQTLDSLPVSEWEPQLALDGGESGLDVITHLLQQTKTRLAPRGRLLLEIEASLGEEAMTATQAAFPEAQRTLYQDIAGHDRIVEIYLD